MDKWVQIILWIMVHMISRHSVAERSKLVMFFYLVRGIEIGALYHSQINRKNLLSCDLKHSLTEVTKPNFSVICVIIMVHMPMETKIKEKETNNHFTYFVKLLQNFYKCKHVQIPEEK